MSTTSHIDNFKDFSSELQIIMFVDSLESVDTYISKEDKFSTNAKISKKDKNITLEIKNRDLFSLEDDKIDNVRVLINDKEFYIDSLQIKSTDTDYSDSRVNFNTIYSLNVLRKCIN